MTVNYVSLMLVLVFFFPEIGHAQVDCPNYIATPEKVYCLDVYERPPIHDPMGDVTPSDEGFVYYEEGEIFPVEEQYSGGGVTVDDTTHP